MTELSFAKSFLTQLEARPIKLQSDYAADLKGYEIKGPYTLPRLPNPMRRPTSTSATTTTTSSSSITGPDAQNPGAAPSITVSLKSLRNPPLDIHLRNQTLTTSVLDLKQAVAEKLGGQVGVDKVRLLWKKKPCSDSRSLKDLLSDEAGTLKEAEFGVMIMGGVSAPAPALGSVAAEKSGDVVMGGTEVEATPVAQGLHGEGVLRTEEFWTDLKGFLAQRIRDDGVAERAWKAFRDGWERGGGK